MNAWIEQRLDGCFPEKLKWRSVDRVSEGVSVQHFVLSRGPDTALLRTYLYIFILFKYIFYSTSQNKSLFLRTLLYGDCFNISSKLKQNAGATPFRKDVCDVEIGWFTAEIARNVAVIRTDL